MRVILRDSIVTAFGCHEPVFIIRIDFLSDFVELVQDVCHLPRLCRHISTTAYVYFGRRFLHRTGIVR